MYLCVERGEEKMSPANRLEGKLKILEKKLPPSGTQTHDLMNTSLILYELCYQVLCCEFSIRKYPNYIIFI